MNKIFKIFLIFIAIVIFTNINFVYGSDDEESSKKTLDLHSVITKPDKAIKKAEEEEEEIYLNKENLQEFSNQIFIVLFAIGVALSVIIGGILGIKFMMSSAEDKAKVKEIMIPYIVGCIVIFGAFGIWKATVEILSKLNQ